jgi:hypothetical protein
MKVLSRQIILITPISVSFTRQIGYDHLIACVKIECSEKWQLAESKSRQTRDEAIFRNCKRINTSTYLI